MIRILPSWSAKFCNPRDNVEMLFSVTYSTALSYSMEFDRHGMKNSVTRLSRSVLYCRLSEIFFSATLFLSALHYLSGNYLESTTAV